eukprot:6197989-Pleurochrysis_carterae.AAC.1
MDRFHHAGGRVASGVEERSEAGEELPYVSGSFVLVTQGVHRFKSCMIIHDDESVAAAAVDRWEEGSREIDMYESSRMRRSVEIAAVSIYRELREAFQVGTPTVQPAVHELGCVVGGHYLDVGRRTR